MIKGAYLFAVLRGCAPLYMWKLYAIDMCRGGNFYILLVMFILYQLLGACIRAVLYIISSLSRKGHSSMMRTAQPNFNK